VFEDAWEGWDWDDSRRRAWDQSLGVCLAAEYCVYAASWSDYQVIHGAAVTHAVAPGEGFVVSGVQADVSARFTATHWRFAEAARERLPFAQLRG